MINIDESINYWLTQNNFSKISDNHYKNVNKSTKFYGITIEFTNKLLKLSYTSQTGFQLSFEKKYNSFSAFIDIIDRFSSYVIEIRSLSDLGR